MEQILKLLKDKSNDRYIFITYQDNKIVGLNYHQGITEKDEHIDYYFTKPDIYLTETFNRMIKRYPNCVNNDSKLFSIINDAIKVHWFVLNYDQCESYYMIRCDDPNKPSTIKPDMYFAFNDLSGLQNYLEICNAHKLNYDLVIEEFDKNNELVISNIYLINKNHLND
jgi:hypothetical protein